MDAIHATLPAGEINFAHVPFDDFESRKPPICCASAQHGAGVGVPLDGDDGLVTKNEVCE
jgi:hypothetical protein